MRSPVQEGLRILQKSCFDRISVFFGNNLSSAGKIRTTTKMASTTEPLSEFPSWGLLPRKETGVLSLINKFPNYDGRGVVLAIFDSGVDPGAPGLQVTTEGKVKVIDRIDASGAGDVDTSTIVEASEGVIAGLSGRKLKVPESWVNPTGKFHIGVKGAYAIYPQRLRERVSKERKEKNWDSVHKALVAEAQRKLQAIESNKSPNGNGGNYLEKLTKEDAESRVAQLNALEKKYYDLGPAYDCVVYHDGEMWRACIDTSERGELESGIHLGEYRLCHQWASLTEADQYNISINVHNDGNILEIVGMCSSHGTHVASIASANFPDSPERNGIAPGAQIVSITIGDNRISSMETGTALARAMMRVMENPHYKVDVINMSYGEHAHWCSSGRLGELANEVVNKYGVIWVASAGNHGPALATVGVPPDFQNDSIIGVGAYVSPDMMTAEYSMIEKLPGCPYTWSSRGPTADGARGVTVCAPGGAITSVPRFTLHSNQLMNGTSMASPHTAGCVGLIVSALKQKSIPYSPYSVRRAIENTALSLDVDIFAQGHGLIQVQHAVEHLIQHSNGVEDKIRFAVECGSERTKGIHLRNWPALKPVDVSVTVEPKLLNDTKADPSEKLSFCMEFVMTCDAPWVRAPPCLQMSYMFRSFQVSIDPRGLSRGGVYFTTVKAYNATNVEKGVMFEVPITIVVPTIDLLHGYFYSSAAEIFRAGCVRRHFLQVPIESTWASVTLKASHSEKCQRFTLHAVQLKPSCSVKTLEYHKVVNLGCNESTTLVFAVRGGYTLELCLARWWSSLVEGQVETSVDFHSLSPSQEEVKLDLYTSFNAAVASGKKAHSLTLNTGAVQPIYLTAPSLSDKTLKGLGLTPGQALLGTLSFAKDELVRKAVSSHKFGRIRTMPDQYQLRVVVTELPCKKRSTASSATGTEEKKETKTHADYLEALRDLQTAWIAKLDSESGEQIHREVMATHPDHLAAQLARLQALDAGGAQNRALVIAQAKQIVSAVDTAPLLAFYGTKTDTRSDAAKIKTQMDKQRNTLLEALSRQGSAMCSDFLQLPVNERPQETLELLDSIATDILKFVEATDSKVNSFFASYYQVREFYGLSSRIVLRQCEEKWTRDNEAKLTDAYTRMGWTHAASLIASSHPLRFPTSFAPF
ncbi:tripeptidyl-peptidase 2 [Palaemon carinicauda]|uniref:tripeptidyl-peptidase 2 n=1 Tax=Palaemon carinicauda TaxID=392227 RepID=UPI0035B6425B